MDTCRGMPVEMFVDMCMSIGIHMCIVTIDMCMDMCIAMHRGTCADMRMNMRIDMRADYAYSQAQRRVCRDAACA